MVLSTFWLFDILARVFSEQQTAQLTSAFATERRHGVSGRNSPCTLNVRHQKEAVASGQIAERIIVFFSVRSKFCVPRAVSVITRLARRRNNFVYSVWFESACRALTFSRHPASVYPKNLYYETLETNQQTPAVKWLRWIVCDFRQLAIKTVGRRYKRRKRNLWRWPFGVVFHSNDRDGFSVPTNVCCDRCLFAVISWQDADIRRQRAVPTDFVSR